ncbi:MAG TPA: hypothetical protein VK157_14085 [Phycisphaerales bacterium]|nr:hypothetical protein [Phycisphaerales bacterium]
MFIDPRFSHMQAAIARSGVGQQALAADPWQVVPAIVAKLGDATLPAELRNELQFAMCVALARLGLRTPASEGLACVEHPAKASLGVMLADMPADEIAVDVLMSVARQNVQAARACDQQVLSEASESWAAWMRRHRAFRTTDGVMTLRRDDGRWSLFMNSVAAARLIGQSGLKDGPFYLDGFHSPHVVETLFDATAQAAGQVQARMVLLAASAEEALTALSLAPLERVLSSSRVELWVGADGPDRVRAEARARIECTLGWALATPAPLFEHVRWPRGELGKVLGAIGEEQERETTSTRDRVMYWDRETAATRDERLQKRLGLRVLLPTTRFSTYVQHAAGDIAATLQEMGHEAVVVRERDDHSILTPLGLLRAIEQLQPDVILFINTLRSQLAETIPPHTTTVTWVQDAMRHLFVDDAAKRPTERDFIMGHLHDEMMRRLHLPRERALATPVLASEQKFHTGPVSEADRERYACDIAYISHQSETPEAYARKLALEAGSNSQFARIVAALTPVVIDTAHAASIHSVPLLPALQEITADVLRQCGGEAAVERGLHDVLHQVTHPIAERALRQQMVTWAADLCEERGWRLHLYGRNWHAHPRFAKFAQGELSHGEALRAAYQCARVQLHAGLGGMHHQRVLECALSGGCTLVRIKADDVRLLEFWAQNAIGTHIDASELEQVAIDGKEYLATPIADHWESMLVYSLYGELGMRPQHELHAKQIIDQSQLKPGSNALPLEAAWLTGDIASSCFWSRESFIASATAVVSRDVRRELLASWQRGATLRHYSLRSQLDRMLRMIGDRIVTTPDACRSA